MSLDWLDEPMFVVSSGFISGHVCRRSSEVRLTFGNVGFRIRQILFWWNFLFYIWNKYVQVVEDSPRVRSPGHSAAWHPDYSIPINKSKQVAPNVSVKTAHWHSGTFLVHGGLDGASINLEVQHQLHIKSREPQTLHYAILYTCNCADL